MQEQGEAGACESREGLGGAGAEAGAGLGCGTGARPCPCLCLQGLQPRGLCCVRSREGQRWGGKRHLGLKGLLTFFLHWVLPSASTGPASCIPAAAFSRFTETASFTGWPNAGRRDSDAPSVACGRSRSMCAALEGHSQPGLERGRGVHETREAPQGHDAQKGKNVSGGRMAGLGPRAPPGTGKSCGASVQEAWGSAEHTAGARKQDHTPQAKELDFPGGQVLTGACEPPRELWQPRCPCPVPRPGRALAC